MRKPWKIGYGVLACAAVTLVVWIAWAVTSYYLDWQSVSADVFNLSGQPLRRVWVECSGPDGRRRQDLGEIVPGASRTARLPVRYEGGSHWGPSFRASYGITLHYVEGMGHVLKSKTVLRNRGSYVEFDVGTGGDIHTITGQTH